MRADGSLAARAMTLERREARQQIRALGDRPLLIQMRITDHTACIKQKHRTRVDATIGVEDAVGAAHGTVRPVIRQQRKRQTAQLLRPCLQTGDGVGADLQNFHIHRLKFFVVLTEPEDLILSAAGEGEGQKTNHGLATMKSG